jgi:hypothetical protein
MPVASPEALATIDEALAIAGSTEEHWIDAELWRLKGSATCLPICQQLP